MRLGGRGDVVAIVTGASSGIGWATSLALARKGATVVAAARNETKLRDLAAEIHTAGGKAIAIPTDVTDNEQITRLVQNTLGQCGKIDLLVCNAGIYVRRRIRDSEPGEYEKSMEVNFFGALRLIHQVLPHMLERHSGHIVAVTSVDGKKGLPPDAPYVAAKFALTGFMDVLRQELRATGVAASTILPGRVNTPMIAHLKVPLASAKISRERVARAIIHAIEGEKAEVIVPFFGPKTLIVASVLFPRLGDLLVRLFGLEGKEESAYIRSSK